MFNWELLGNLMMIRVTSVNWTWLGLKWPLASMLLNVMHHCFLVSYSRTLYILVLMKLLVFKSLFGKLYKMIIAKLGRQHQRSLDSYFKSSCEYLYLFGVISYWFIPSILLKLVVPVYVSSYVTYNTIFVNWRLWEVSN